MPRSPKQRLQDTKPRTVCNRHGWSWSHKKSTPIAFASPYTKRRRNTRMNKGKFKESEKQRASCFTISEAVKPNEPMDKATVEPCNQNGISDELYHCDGKQFWREILKGMCIVKNANIEKVIRVENFQSGNIFLKSPIARINITRSDL